MKMKKTIIVLCCVIIASIGIVLTGCGSSGSDKNAESSSDKYADSPYVGTWEAKFVEYEGNQYDAEEAIGGAALMIDEDGTAIYMGSGTRIDDKWEPTEDGLKIWKEGGTEEGIYNIVYKDEMLIMDVETETEGELMTIYFEKEDNSGKDADSSDKDTESSSDKDAENSSAKYSDGTYVGTWELTAAEFEGDKVEGDDLKEVMGDVKFIIYDDGTATYMIDDESTVGEWEPTEDGVKFKEGGVREFSFVYKEEMLVVDVEVEVGEAVLTEYYKKVD